MDPIAAINTRKCLQQVIQKSTSWEKNYTQLKIKKFSLNNIIKKSVLRHDKTSFLQFISNKIYIIVRVCLIQGLVLIFDVKKMQSQSTCIKKIDNSIMN